LILNFNPAGFPEANVSENLPGFFSGF